MRNRKQRGCVVRIGENWHVRYWQVTYEHGSEVRKRYSHLIGPVTTRGRKPPADVVDEAERYVSQTVNNCKIKPKHVVGFAEFVECVFLPVVEQHRRPSTAKGYKDIWENRLKPAAVRDRVPMKDLRPFHVQQWLDEIGEAGLSRNSLKHTKSVISGIFTLARNRGYYTESNPVQGTTTNPAAKEAAETYAYGLSEVRSLLAFLPEPVATVFAVAAFTGLRHGELQGLRWEDFKKTQFEDSEREALFVNRSIWNGREGKPKTGKSAAPVPVIRQLAERLEMHRARSGSPTTGPIFRNGAGKPMSLGSVVNRVIAPLLNRCAVCHKSEMEPKAHPEECSGHNYERDDSLPKWRGWHAARRGLASNLYSLGVHEKVIQQILRHSNVSITMTYYVKPLGRDVADGMSKLEEKFDEKTAVQISQDSERTVNEPSAARSTAIQ
jgi:integrase